MSAYVIVAACVIRSGEVLLVRHNSEFGSVPYWTLPGGTAEAGESALDAVVREVFEETGLAVNSVGRLAYLAQHFNHRRAWQSDVLCFLVEDYRGDLDVKGDPDRDTLEAQFFPIDVAIGLLKGCPFDVIGLQAAHCLQTAPSQAVPIWIFHESPEGEVTVTHAPID